MQKIKLRSKVGKDGILHLDIPVGVTETELKVTLMFEVDRLPSQRTYGICADDPIVIDDELIREDEVEME